MEEEIEKQCRKSNSGCTVTIVKGELRGGQERRNSDPEDGLFQG